VSDPGPGRVGGDPRDVHAPGAVLDEDQGVEASEEHGVDVGEVDGEDRLGLRGEELFPGRPGPARRWIYSGGVQDLPDRGCGDAVAEPDEFTVDSSASPGRVLPRQLEHQIADGPRGRWSSWSSSRIGPAARDQLGVPAQQGAGRDDPVQA